MRDKKIVQKSLLVSLILTLSAITASAQTNRLKVITWNIAGGTCGHARTDMPSLANQIRAKNADVIAVQEVHFDQAYLLAFYLNPTKPYNVQFVWTKRCFNKYFSSFIDYGNAILSRHPIHAEGGLWDGGFYVSPDPDRLLPEFPEYIRVAQASVQLPKPNGAPGGPWVRIYGAHLTGNNGLPPKGADNAIRQVKDTMNHIDKDDANALGRQYAILMGDFNAYPSTGPCTPTQRGGYNSYDWLTYPYRADLYFKDAWLAQPRAANDCGNTGILSTAQNPDKRYDYIFLRNASKFKVERMEVVNMQPRHLSDHFPVYAELTF